MSSTNYDTLIQGRTDADREAEAVGIDSDIRYCACGCGEPLKATQKSQWVRGHRMAKIAEKTSKDPEPATPRESPTVSQETWRDVEDQLSFWLALIGFAWESRDPLCGAEFSDRTNQLAEKLVPIIVRNPRMLKIFTDSGNFKMWVDVLTVLAPVGKSVVKHHVFHSIGVVEALDNELPNGVDVHYPV